MAEEVVISAAEETSRAACFGGHVVSFKHPSKVLECTMAFTAFVPPQAAHHKVPVVYFLSGLTCNDQNFITKAGAQRTAAKLGLCLVCPDTSPRGVKIEGDDAAWDFGVGAGFYVDATEAPWSAHYRMFSYITAELPLVVEKTLPVSDAASIMGHSMGGHGALVASLRCPGQYVSVSAFAPIAHPSACPWGKKAFTGYLGQDQSTWAAYDSTELVKGYDGPPLDILIDQGKKDNFLAQQQLLPEDFVDASRENKSVKVSLRYHDDYDHSYYFISTFIDDHLRHHATALHQAEAASAAVPFCSQ